MLTQKRRINMGIFSKIFSNIKYAFTKNELTDDFYDELEQTLISSDMGVETSLDIVDNFKSELKKRQIKDVENAQKVLRELLINELNQYDPVTFNYPTLISIIGVNGVGKTTTIAKMTKFFQKSKKSVLLVAGDTFRAGAVDQLDTWAKKLNARIVKQGEGADAGSVVFDGISSAKAKNIDVVLVDTAGRLHTKVNLMNELQKIAKIITREAQDYELHNFIVLDSSIGQNSLQQVKAFKDVVDIDGIIMTKLDGTAKGGVAFQIVKELEVPIIFTCFGETIDDIAVFDAEDFVDKILM